MIGRTCRRVGVDEALDYVAGYTCLNDVSARDLQYADKQFVARQVARHVLPRWVRGW